MKNQLKELSMKMFNLVEAAPVQVEDVKVFAQIADAEGKVYSYEGETLTVGAILYDGEEGSEILAGAGTISLEDGSSIVVGEGGLVEELIDAAAEDAPVEEEEALQAAPKSIEESVVTKTSFEGESGTEDTSNLEAILFAVAEIVNPLITRLEALEGGAATELSAAKKELSKAKEDVAKLSKLPAADSHKVKPTVKNNTPKAGSKFDRMKASGNFSSNTLNK